MSGTAQASHSSTQNDYRRDIDGLRAFAILSVLLYHAEPTWVPGGFVGVDVFFVISGYLISRIILGRLNAGTFTFTDFYARRIRRIFPALTVVLSATFGIGWYCLFPDEYSMLGKHIAGGAGFLSNLILWKEAGYFDPAAEFKPLLHLWSLGIEEQFYLVWPLLLVFTSKVRRGPLLIMGLIAAASFLLNLAWIADHGVRVFYLPITRFWELAAGGMLAHVHLSLEADRNRAVRPASPLQAAKSALGFALLLISAFAFSRQDLYPGWRAALPVLGTVLLIDAGADTPLNRRVLGNRAMVFVGVISYPLYLWHWPLLSFEHIIARDEVTHAAIWGAVAAAFILAWATYRFIERPIRHSPPNRRTPLLLAGTLASLGLVGLLDFRLLLPPRSNSFDVRNIVQASTAIAFPGPRLHQVPGERSDNAREQGSGPHAVLFMGDSQIEQYYPRMDWVLSQQRERPAHILYSSQGGCPPVPGVHEDHLPKCEGLIEQGMRIAARADVDTIVIAADWAGYFLNLRPPDNLDYYYRDATLRGSLGDLESPASNLALARFQDMIGAMTGAGKQVYLVLPSPTGREFGPRKIVQRSFSDMSFKLRLPVISATNIESRVAPIVQALKRIAARTNATLIDPIEHLCNHDICPVLAADGEPMYKDASHLSPLFVRRNVRYLDQVLKSTSVAPMTETTPHVHATLLQ
ncbi:MAG: acyltransferase [Proteobacteria bacterium]|nr:acyltransferase [Pseudomonadota bacterium]